MYNRGGQYSGGHVIKFRAAHYNTIARTAWRLKSLASGLLPQQSINIKSPFYNTSVRGSIHNTFLLPFCEYFLLFNHGPLQVLQRSDFTCFAYNPFTLFHGRGCQKCWENIPQRYEVYHWCDSETWIFQSYIYWDQQIFNNGSVWFLNPDPEIIRIILFCKTIFFCQFKTYVLPHTWLQWDK